MEAAEALEATVAAMEAAAGETLASVKAEVASMAADETR